MSSDARTLCVVCAWRASCAKRFSMSADTTLHCPDYTEDVALKKEGQRLEGHVEEKDSGQP
ncbi:MAG: hypothetical protein C0614_04845 [Desulfuromonas sp.]|nr:MAG: hypothetical protein C0614_04845 [Desulfuromonas sp.]